MGLGSTEANAFLILMPLLFLIIFSEPLYRSWAQDKSPLTISQTVYLDSLVTKIEKQKPVTVIESVVLMPFDPNLATLDELTSLGISEKISKRIVQYRSKGGSFRIKSDLSKMYGMDSTLYKKLLPFIALPDKLDKKEFVKSEKPISIIQHDINLADTASLKSVRGIGSVLARRIIKYRDGLGGFIHIDQLKEVFGLDSMVISALNEFYISDEFIPKKIAINKATEKELDAHPYLSLRDAKTILTFRAQHGNYSSADELMKIKTMKESTVTKIGPYLSFE